MRNIPIALNRDVLCMVRFFKTLYIKTTKRPASIKSLGSTVMPLFNGIRNRLPKGKKTNSSNNKNSIMMFEHRKWVNPYTEHYILKQGNDCHNAIYHCLSKINR